MAATDEWSLDELAGPLRRACPFRDLGRCSLRRCSTC
jgi:hypothetical protein